MNRHPAQGGPLRPVDPRLLGFSDRVMTQVAAEPRPTPARVFMRSMLHLRLRDAAAVLATAWHLAFGRTGPIPALVRVQSLVVLLVFTIAVGTGGTLAAAGAARIIESPREPRQVDRPLVLPPVSPGPNVGEPPSVRVSPSPSPSGLRREIGTGRTTDEEVPGPGRGDRARERQPEAGSGDGDKSEQRSTTQKKKQPAKATPKPTSQKQRGNDTPKAGSGTGDQSKSTDTDQKATAPGTPTPGSGDGAKSQEGTDGGSGRGS